jgi:hypothetical protein
MGSNEVTSEARSVLDTKGIFFSLPHMQPWGKGIKHTPTLKGLNMKRRSERS